MQIKYRINFDEPIRLDEAWPLSLPNNGIFRVIEDRRLAAAFEISFTQEVASCVEGSPTLSQETVQQWAQMRRYFARLKGYIQCLVEINYDPVEVELIFEAESEDEKQFVPVDKVLVTRRERRKRTKVLSYETLCGAVIGSLAEQQSSHRFIGELKSLSMRAEREGRYVDSFRYGFLLLDAIYGKGQFKTNNLKRAFTSDKVLMDVVREVRLRMKEKIQSIDDDTDRLLSGDSGDSDIIEHLISKRGHYFHGKNGALRELDWADEEGRTLSRFVNEITDLICKEELRRVLTEESWAIYEDSARRSENLVELSLEAQIWDMRQRKTIVSHNACEKVGSIDNEFNRVQWAYEALVSLMVDSDYQEVESILGKDKENGTFVFSIELGTSRTMFLETWKPAFREGSEFVPMADVRYYFGEDREEEEAELRIQVENDVVVFDNKMALTLAGASILYMDRVFEGIYLIEGVERESKVKLFRICLREN